MRLEQAVRKLQAELKATTDRANGAEEEVVTQKTDLDKLRRDLLTAKEDTHSTIHVKSFKMFTSIKNNDSAKILYYSMILLNISRQFNKIIYIPHRKVWLTSSVRRCWYSS